MPKSSTGLRLKLARCAGLGSAWILRHIFHRSASTLPGRVALALQPQMVASAVAQCRQGCVVVCGTNGKTTTTNLIANALERTGAQVLCNRTGANMASGVASALLPARHVDWGVFEVDELSTITLLPQLRPRYFVLLNLFRDQLDRSGEIDRVQAVIVSALQASPGTVLVYNADDPMCEGIARACARQGTTSVPFGIDGDLHLPATRVRGGRFCQHCGAPLDYRWHQYDQLGAYSCPDCGFSRPDPVFCATQVSLDGRGLTFGLVDRRCAENAGTFPRPGAVPDAQSDSRPGAVPDAQSDSRPGAQPDAEPGTQPKAQLHSNWGGAYMVYNLLAAWSCLCLLGVKTRALQDAIDSYRADNGRLQQFVVGGYPVTLNLAKNPTGFNQNISLMLSQPGPKTVYIVINDNYNDGRDVSWLWDVDCELIAQDPQVVACMTGGIRANDMQLRLKYAGTDAELIQDVSRVLARARQDNPDGSLYVLTNYSALWRVRDELGQLAKEQA